MVLRSGNEGPVSGLEQIRVPSSGESASDQVGSKHMFIMFWDRRGMILQQAVPKDTTVNAGYYSKVNITHI